MSTNFNVIQAQRDLAIARNSELQAQLDYQLALIAFETVQQTVHAGRATLRTRRAVSAAARDQGRSGPATSLPGPDPRRILEHQFGNDMAVSGASSTPLR